MIGLVGTKLGMSRFFTPEGISIPVTVIKVNVNFVTQIKSFDKDGYQAVQLTTGEQKKNRVSKPLAEHCNKAGVKMGRGLWEFSLSKEESNNFVVGQGINLNLFRDIKKVDITGTSKGKGFAGTVKRWNFHTQDASHGNSLSHRVPGSIGQNQTPGRVFKGKKMAGRLGNQRVTIQGLRVVQIDSDNNFIMVKGAVPGATGTNIFIKPAVKEYPLRSNSLWN
ncbi:MAG: 50S ribosomal protein L3 [Candidatus Dasytiphilus stammeri]